MGLHFSDHPKLSNQHSTLLVKVDDYYFHIPQLKKTSKDSSILVHWIKIIGIPKLKCHYQKPKKLFIII